MVKKLLKLTYRMAAFTGLYLVPVVLLVFPEVLPSVSLTHQLLICLALMAWTSFNNFWSVACEGKRLDEIGIGEGLVPETGLKKESPQKRIAMYPKVPPELLSKKPEGIILGKYKSQYVRIPGKTVMHTCVLGGSGSGKSSTVLLDTLLMNFAAENDTFTCFAIDIKGELYRKSTFAYSENVLVCNPEDRSSCGWDVYYRLHGDPSEDILVIAMKEIAQALVVSTNPKDSFFVENARDMLTGLLLYFFKQGETFIDSISRILEAETIELIGTILQDSDQTALWYKYLAKYNGKQSEAISDIISEMTTNLSVFNLQDIKYMFRDNYQKASPDSFREGKSVFLAIPEHMLDQYKTIMRLCTVQTLREMERREDARGRDEITEKPMLLIIDEFARIGRMDNIFNALSTLASKNVSLILAFQSLGQCEMIYSREEARVLTDNCRVKVICEVSDPETARTVSDWCGKYRDKKETLNGGKGRHKSYTYEDKPIIEASDLITLVRDGEEILIYSGVGYLKVEKCYYFKDKILKVLAEKVRSTYQGGTTL